MKKLLFTLILLMCSFTINAQNTKNYLSIDSISFEKESYNLIWSSSPNNNYYKHEYLRKTDSISNYNKMILVEVLLQDITPKDLALKKLQQIEKKKETDPIANYQLIENPNTGEYLLDFLISDGNLYEWNVYRYQLINTPKGKAIMLFGFSLRSFEGAELSLDDFFPYLKENRMSIINTIANQKLPNITLPE